MFRSVPAAALPWHEAPRQRRHRRAGAQLALEFASLYKQLLAGRRHRRHREVSTSRRPGPQRSRTYDIGVDQNILGEKLILKAGYFHNIFDHQLEGVDSGALEQVFGYPPSVVTRLHALPQLARLPRAGLRDRDPVSALKPLLPPRRLYLSRRRRHAVLLQRRRSNGTFNNNPNLPGIPIGAEGPLVGPVPSAARRTLASSRRSTPLNKFSAAFKGALASRSDDSTFLDGFDPNFGNTLLLPNRNLDFGYAKLDANVSTPPPTTSPSSPSSDNLLSQQHIGPIGYPGLPFTFRAGLKIRIGGN